MSMPPSILRQYIKEEFVAAIDEKIKELRDGPDMMDADLWDGLIRERNRVVRFLNLTIVPLPPSRISGK